MSWWDRVKAVLKSEASDVGEELGKIGSALDDELARKEAELAATPAERLDMILDDIEQADAEFDALTAEAQPEEPAATQAAAPAGPATPLLDQADFADRAHLRVVLPSVTVEPTQAADPLFDRFRHSAWIDDRLEEALGETDLAAIAREVAEHPLVDAALFEDRQVLYVQAPLLHPEDIRLVVATALAGAMPGSADGSPS